MDQLDATPSGLILSPRAVNALLPATILLLICAKITLLRWIGWLLSTFEVDEENQYVTF